MMSFYLREVDLFFRIPGSDLNQPKIGGSEGSGNCLITLFTIERTYEIGT